MNNIDGENFVELKGVSKVYRMGKWKSGQWTD